MTNQINGNGNGNGTGNPPTIDQLLAEGHARIRRMTNDQVFLGNLLDTLVQEIVAREKKLQEARVEAEAVG
jgi:hypothetical protein